MTSPLVSAVGNIDRFNKCICTVSFETVPTPDQQSRLVSATKSFNNSSPGGALKPRYHLTFCGRTMTVCQSTMTEAPTKLQVTEFLDHLSIVHPDDSPSEAAPVTTTPLPVRHARGGTTPLTAARR